MAEPLAKTTDLVERLGRDLTEQETIRSQTLLLDASSAVRAAAGGQEISEATSDAFVFPRRERIMLPQVPVTAVNSVKNVIGTDITFSWYAGFTAYVGWDAYLNQFDVEPFYFPARVPLVVNYTHGYAVVPDEIVAVVCGIAARALGQPPDTTGVIQESLGGYAYTLGSAAAAGGLGMLDSERAIALRYARPRPSISMLC
jgi:hypothetical protein